MRTAQAANDPGNGFEEFYTGAYRAVLATVLAVGATLPEAEDAVQDAMRDVLVAWGRVANPLAYARTAAVRGLVRTRMRTRDGERRGRLAAVLLARSEPTPWEDREWVTQVLQALPPAQREVLGLLVDAFTPAEIATLLGKTEAAVRQNLAETRRRLGVRPGERPDVSVLPLEPTTTEAGR